MKCECGEPLGACEQAWAECLSLEFSDPDYGAVHHLTVPAFMLQHPSRLSAHGWREERRLLTEFIEEVTHPATVLRRTRPTGPSLKRGAPRVLGDIEWSRTLVGVATTEAGTYRSEIEAWAKAVLSDIDRLDLAEG